MNDRPVLFYLYEEGNDYVIVEQTDAKAMELWNKGTKFKGIGQKTRAEAEQLREQYLADKMR